MKQIFLILLSASLFTISNAQTSFGVKGGLNLSHDVGIDASNSKNFKAGFHAGVFAGISITKKLSIQPELMYSAQGGYYDYNGYSSGTDLNYLKLPVLVKYTTASGFYGETGPQVGYLIGVKANSGYNTELTKHSLTKSDFSWAFGIGYKSASNVGIDLRYNLSFTDTYKSGIGVHNNALQLGLHYVLIRK
jgi:hypothetical protein